MNNLIYLIKEGAKSNSPISRLILDLLGYGGHWTRRVMNNDINMFVQTLPVSKLEAAEISGHHYALLPWQNYKVLEYPEYDICCDEIDLTSSFDIIFCEQVLEHIWQPQKALNNLYQWIKPGGWLVVSTPFLVKIHKCPEDYWRFTPDCLYRMLIEADFKVEKHTSWGNESCVKANLTPGPWARYYPFRNLKNDPDLPVVVWSYAQKSSNFNE